MAQPKFERQVQRWAVKAQINARLLVKATAFRLFGRIIDLTPRDTGRAQSNWSLVSGDQADLGIREAGSTPLVRVTTSDVYTISNNLPYIVPLEEGHSKQAPHGMVKVALATERAILETELGR